MPFKLEPFSAPRTRVVHVHHHHYSSSVDDSSEDDYEEDDYEEDEFSENTSESEFSGNIESDYQYTTSCDDDSCYSGYDE